MFGAVAFYDAALDKGVKPILGCEIYVAPGSRHDKAGSGIEEAYNHMTLLASDETGYHNLVKLVSIGYTEGFYHRPRIDKEVLAKPIEGAHRPLRLPVRRDRPAHPRRTGGLGPAVDRDLQRDLRRRTGSSWK